MVFLNPTAQYLRFSTFLVDPCPYDGGARPELSDLLVQYRLANSNEPKTNFQQDSDTKQTEWSEVQVCKNLVMLKNPINTNLNKLNETTEFIEESNEFGIKWAGDVPIPCELSVTNTDKVYEVCVGLFLFF